MSNMVVREKRSIKTLLFFIILSMAATYIIFAPTITIPFYHHDLYKFSYGGFHKACNEMSNYRFLFKVARPISAWLDCLNFKLAYTLEKMSMMRLACVVLTGLTMAFFAYWLYCVAALSFWIAFFISGAIFCLPGIQTVMIMAATNLILAGMLALLANYWISKSLQTHDNLAKPSSRFHQALLFLGGILALFASFFTYPSFTGFFLVPTLVTILWSPLIDWKKTRLTLIQIGVIFVACSGIFFLIARSIEDHRVRGGLNNMMGAYQFKVNFDLTGRLLALPKILTMLWNVYAGTFQLILVAVILALGVAIAIFKKDKRVTTFTLIQATVAVTGWMLLGASFYLAQPENVMFGRITFISQAMAVILLAWCLYQISSLFAPRQHKWAISLLGLMFFVASVQTNYTITKSALSDNLELTFVTSKIASYLQTNKTLSRIHIKILSDDKSFVGLRARDDIFTLASTTFPGSILNLLYTALDRLDKTKPFHDCLVATPSYNEEEAKNAFLCVKKAPENSLAVTSSRGNEPIIPTANMLLIDMNELLAPDYH